jgi:NADH-quinone oxidoreductase subunit J
VLMLLGVESQEALRETIKGQRPAAVLLTLGLLVAVVAALFAGVFDAGPTSLAAANEGGNVQAVGRLLFTRYTFAFEIAGILLVVAAVGALVLGKRQRP